MLLLSDYKLLKTCIVSWYLLKYLPIGRAILILPWLQSHSKSLLRPHLLFLLRMQTNYCWADTCCMSQDRYLLPLANTYSLIRYSPYFLTVFHNVAIAKIPMRKYSLFLHTWYLKFLKVWTENSLVKADNFFKNNVNIF